VTLKQELAEIAAAVDEARRAVAEGAMVEIDGLDTAVAKVCEGAQSAPAEERSALAQDLVALAEALDALATDIQRQSDAVERQRASSAYGNGG
jgi:hypothetical protein